MYIKRPSEHKNNRNSSRCKHLDNSKRVVYITVRGQTKREEFPLLFSKKKKCTIITPELKPCIKIVH